VAVVNKAFVERFFPKDNPLDQSIAVEWGEDPTPVMRPIAGVVGDVRGTGLADAPEPTIYVSMAQYPFSSVRLVVRANGDLGPFAAELRRVIRDLDREVPVYSVQTMRERLAGSLERERFFATLIAVFAAVALLLSAVGLYGVITYAVTQRTHELGVRVALGASGGRISRMVLGEGAWLTAAGLIVGLGASLAGHRLLSTLLHDTGPADSLTLAGVVATLAAVALLASWIPARRASRVDPLVAMRGD